MTASKRNNRNEPETQEVAPDVKPTFKSVIIEINLMPGFNYIGNICDILNNIRKFLGFQKSADDVKLVDIVKTVQEFVELRDIPVQYNDEDNEAYDNEYISDDDEPYEELPEDSEMELANFHANPEARNDE